METFGGRVRRLRESHGLSQVELAGRVGVSQSNVSAYEGDRQEPKMGILIELARTFGVSLDYMCCLTNTEH